jgi:signal transduction histidine kinase/HAMP domain-containing protein/ActR/RegA family two-component response regulator
MKTDRGIQRRLLVILGLGVAAIALASTLAILALTDLGRSFRAVSQYEVPAMVAGLDLARHAATIEGRGPSLIAAENEWERYRQATLLEQDFSSLDEALKRFKHGSPRAAAAEVAEIDQQVKTIRGTLDAIKGLLSVLAERQRMQRVAIARLMKTQDGLRQAFVPTLLALSQTISTGYEDDIGQLRHIATIRDPLTQAERLLDASMNALLLAVDQRNVGDLVATRGHVERLFGQLDLVAQQVPVGLRPAFQWAIQELRQAANGTDGLIRNRIEELESRERLASLVEANRGAGAGLNFRTRRVLAIVQEDVDRANDRIDHSVASHTTAQILISLTAVLLAALVSYFFVVRDLGRNLHAVTEAMIRLANGERGVSVPATRRADELGALARAFQVFRDTAQTLERIDQELRQKSEHLLVTFENMNDGLSVFDSDGMLVTWNAKFLELYDLAPDDIGIGTTLERIVEGLAGMGVQTFDQNGHPVPVRELMKARTAKVRQYEIRTPSGRFVELRSNPTPGGFVTVHTDRTQRRSIEAQLMHAQKMEMVGQLTGGVAHDFNNILAVVTGNLHLLREQLVAAGGATERLDRAMAAVDRATMQIDRMLTFARRQTLHPQCADVNELISGMLDLVTLSVGSAVEVREDLAPDLPSLMIDVGQMENALLNLAVNARDAMGDGGTLTFSTRRVSLAKTDTGLGGPAPGDYIEVVVADTGCGMAADVLSRAVEPFFTTKERGRGNGLGLSMVYGFVKQSGGELRIGSEPGQGTRIALILPAAVEIPPEAARPALPDASTGPLATGEGEAILLVEDAPDLLEVNAALLRRWNYEVLCADRGEKALAVLAANPGIRLLLTDIGLKDGMDGTEVVRAALASRPDLAVLLTSAHSTDSLAETVTVPEVLAAWPFIGKPADPLHLNRMVRAAIDGAVQTVSTSASNT